MTEYPFIVGEIVEISGRRYKVVMIERDRLRLTLELIP